MWLLTRTLFRFEGALKPWTLMVVAGIIAVEGFWNVTGLGMQAGGGGEVRRIATNAASLICISVIALVFVEALHDFSPRLSHLERRFRQTFVAIFATIIAITIVWAVNLEETSSMAELAETITALCALVCVLGMRAAIAFRKRHPLATIATTLSRAGPAAARDTVLGKRIKTAIAEDQRFATPDLKVANLAAVLGEPEYKISQCIVGALGYRNFNHFVNAHRIAHAKDALADARRNATPIAAIAFECGFNSIGPFNRAFKQEVGMTPREFRHETTCARRAAETSDD